MQCIDLRSDTVTKPTPEMREAMMRAEVGDDVYLEDPTINLLQEKAAEMFGREASLFVPTGTMGNQVSVKVHTQPGQEVVIEEKGHIFNYELSAMAVVSGTIARPFRVEDGIPDWDTVEGAIRAGGAYYRAKTGLVALENTHNMAGGAVMSKTRMHEICGRAHALGLPVHLDGARIFNAATALGEPVDELTRPFDSVMFCLSKGLGAPAGSMVVGSREFIEKARGVRKMLGGGMRQVGVLGAAGLICLEKMTKRLKEDHDNARFIATELAQLSGIAIDPEKLPTNIVIFDIAGTGLKTATFSERLKQRGVLANGINDREMRMVTHYDVSRPDCEAAVAAVREILAK